MSRRDKVLLSSASVLVVGSLAIDAALMGLRLAWALLGVVALIVAGFYWSRT